VPSIDWLPWHTAAFLEAQRRRRPVLLLLETAWSPACGRAHAEVFSRGDVIAAIADATVPIRVDADLRPDIADRYGLGHWPSLLVLTPEGHVLTGGTHLHDALAERIRDAARAFSEHSGPWPSALPAAPRYTTGLDDGAAAIDAFAMAIDATRDPRTGACVHDGRPSASAALFALAHATARGDADWASTAADTIDALHDAVPDLDEAGVVAFVTDVDGFDPVARLEDQAEWILTIARAVRLEPLPAWTSQLDRLVRGLRSAFRRDDGHWRPWTGSPRVVLVDASARACRALLAAADALDSPDFAGEAIESLEVLAPVAYSRGSGVSHTIVDGRVRGPVLLDDAMLLAHALLDADAWRTDPVYRDLAEELVRTSLARLQDRSGAIRDRVAALAGAGQVGRLADPYQPLMGNAAAARLLCRLFPDDAEQAAEARRILAAVTPEALAAGTFGAPVGLAWHALGAAGGIIAAW
jgi:uncharacterized protein